MVTRFRADLVQAIAPHPRTRAEFEHRVRSLSLTDAVFTVAWLNGAKGTQARKEVLEIRDELEALGTMMTSLHETRQRARAQRKGRALPHPETEAEEFRNLVKGVEEFGAQQKQVHARVEALNKRIAKFVFCPVMVYYPSSDEWRYQVIPRKPRGRQILISYDGQPVQVNAATAVAALCRLAANGELHKLRLCEWCKASWRVSERAIDRFCSDECRQDWYKSQPTFKQRRKKIQREYRERLFPKQKGR